MTARELVVRSGNISLAGSLWLPDGDAVATMLMHPGSGPSDRDNDVYFPPIRDLLAEGVAVCSFDKRGVGSSGGRWQDAAIVEQADDSPESMTSIQRRGSSGSLSHDLTS